MRGLTTPAFSVVTLSGLYKNDSHSTAKMAMKAIEGAYAQGMERMEKFLEIFHDVISPFT
jgi:multimeric flavodoxin WrbA